MRLSATFTAILLATASSLSFAIGSSKPRIDSIDPGFMRVGEQNVVVISGKNLNQKGITCAVTPVSMPSTVSPLQKMCDSAKFITGTGQLKLTINVPDQWPAGALLLTLQDTSGATIYALASVLAVGAVTAATVPKNITPGSPSQTSPFATCLNATATNSAILNPPSGSSSPNVNCASSLLSEAEVRDNFGQHIDHTYYAIQVRVSNQNPNFDFLVRDILLTLPDGRVVSSRIRRFAQGVAVKGRSLDRRAGFYNALQAGTGLFGALAVFGSAGYQTVGNVLQGSFLSGFAQIFPDYTADNVNRFNTAIFDDQNPSIVPKSGVSQTALNVVALVPKMPGVKDPHFGERIAVSIEGTYIEQVSLVALSTSSLDFGSEFISPDQISSLLSQDVLTNLRDQGHEQSFTISNNNSAPMNISKIDIVPNTKSSLTLTDASLGAFSIDGTKTTCGQTTPGTAFNPTNAFTIPAQSFCTVYIQFHPAGIGDSSATLNLEGTTLDGPRTVALTGKSVGLIVNTNAVSLPGNPSTVSTLFPCSFQSTCTIDLGFVGTSNTATVPFGFVSTNTTVSLTAVQDGTTSLGSCTAIAESSVANNGFALPCNLVVNLNKNPTTVILTNSSTKVSATLNFKYQTVQPSIVLDDSSTFSGTQTIAAITGTLQNTQGNPIAGTVTATDANAKVTTVVVLADGKISIPLSNLKAGGPYTYKLTSLETGSYAAAKTVNATLNVTGVATFSPVSPSIIVTRNAIPSTTDVFIKTTQGAICSGTVTYAPGPSVGPATLSGGAIDATGSVTISVQAPLDATIGTFNGTLTYTPSSAVCTAASAPFTYTVQ